MAEQIKERKLPNYTPFQIIGRKKREQKKIDIKGIEVYFPYDVYPNQIAYMEKVIELLNNNLIRTNYTNIGALESPTGTGKTLCLLCSTLAWMNEMRNQKKFGGKIIYTTRTHSQISQIIHELQKTCYWPNTAVLSSRDISCVNQKIRQNSSGTILNIKCRLNNGLCSYYNGVLHDKRERNNCLDIESLCINGKKQNFCPFYQQIESAKTYSDIAFMPYNYIFDEDINTIMGIDIENNIIIIDEAHNLRRVCEESKSVEINNKDFDDIISDIEQLINYDKAEEAMRNIIVKPDKKKVPLIEMSKQALNITKNNIISIQKKFNSSKIKIEVGGKKLTYNEFFDIFISDKASTNKRRRKIISYESNESTINSDIDNVPEIINISNIKEHINFFIKVERAFEDYYEKGTKISILLKIFNIIKQLTDNINLQSSYYYFIENEEVTQQNKELNKTEIKKIRKLNIFCFSPQIGFSDILKRNPYSIIFTSGTLTPFKIFEDELQIKFDLTLENKHIVPNDQFIFKIISSYSETGKYRFDYNSRDDNEMIKALGYEILNYCIQTPYGGILVFFPSYFYLNKCNCIFNSSGINLKIENYKRLYIDSAKDKTLINQIKKNPNKNYIVFSVFRGTSSEDIDFSDDSARVVICVGVPFANTTEKRVKLKIEYLNNINKKKKKIIEGSEWYLVDAMTAVNQSLGRVIRHSNDYGVMICIDERYNNFEKYFSFWIREHYNIYKNNNLNIKDFFTKQKEKCKHIKLKKSNIQSNEDTNKSGFNSIITLEDNNSFENNNKNNKIENCENNNNDIIDIKVSDEIEMISSDEATYNDYNMILYITKLNKTNNNLNVFHNDNDNIDKIKYNKIFTLNFYENLNEENKNINLINVKKKHKENEDNPIKIQFNQHQKEGMDLLESINQFLNNNTNEFNKILNKYK